MISSDYGTLAGLETELDVQKHIADRLNGIGSGLDILASQSEENTAAIYKALGAILEEVGSMRIATDKIADALAIMAGQRS